jgi:tetratricopeptide (TPR) repeat protein
MEIAGRLFAENHWYADAERCLTAALKMDPQRTTAAGQLAQVFAATGDLNAAADSAAKTGGNSAALLAGVKAQERNDVSGAIENYERAVRGGEKTGVAANNLAWLYAQQGTNLQHALELAQTAQSLAPHDPAVLDTVGFVHLRLREYSDAIQALESAKRIAMRNPAQPQLLAQIRQHLAEAYLRAGKNEQAAAERE